MLWLSLAALGLLAGPVARYIVPFESGTPVLVLQGYSGPWGHSGHAEYAYDFRADIGTAVLAARAGVVVKTEARFSDGNRTPGQENFVIVKHADGTFARYYHLTKGGVAVQPNDSVKRGTLIGRSGDTGASAGPHLHFDVTVDCPDWGCRTVPIAFSDTPENPLRSGHSYLVPKDR